MKIDRDGLYERGSCRRASAGRSRDSPVSVTRLGGIFSNLYRVGYDGDCIIEHEDRRFEATDQLIKRGFILAASTLRPFIPKGY